MKNNEQNRLEALEIDYQELRIRLIQNSEKMESQLEWNKHLNAEITRLLKYEKETKSAMAIWNNPKIWDVWAFFLRWLFPPQKKQERYPIWPNPPKRERR